MPTSVATAMTAEPVQTRSLATARKNALLPLVEPRAAVAAALARRRIIAEPTSRVNFLARQNASHLKNHLRPLVSKGSVLKAASSMAAFKVPEIRSSVMLPKDLAQTNTNVATPPMGSLLAWILEQLAVPTVLI